MTGHDIDFFITFSQPWSSNTVTFNDSHVSYSVYLLNINVIQFLQVLFYLRFSQFLVSLKS
jgi:hypothetical protein